MEVGPHALVCTLGLHEVHFTLTEKLLTSTSKTVSDDEESPQPCQILGTPHSVLVESPVHRNQLASSHNAGKSVFLESLFLTSFETVTVAV